LLEKKVDFKQVKVDMSNKSEEFVELYHSIIPDRDVRERVPVLVHGPKRLVDHTTIVEYLATAYPESGTPLTPPDPYAAARVKLFCQYFADHVVPAYNHLIHAGEGHVGEAKEALMKALAAVDEFLALHGAGEGEYAVGPHYGWSMTSADQECEGRKLGRVAGWMKACLARPAAKLTGPNRKELVDGLVEWEWSHAV
jgi:glutathione S-transferase